MYKLIYMRLVLRNLYIFTYFTYVRMYLHTNSCNIYPASCIAFFGKPIKYVVGFSRYLKFLELIEKQLQLYWYDTNNAITPFKLSKCCYVTRPAFEFLKFRKTIDFRLPASQPTCQQ